MKKVVVIISILIYCLLLVNMQAIYAQSKRDLKKLEKEIELKARYEELNGKLEAQVTTFHCEYYSKNLKIALRPFELKGKKVYTENTENEYIDLDYSPQNVLRDYFEAYLGQIGWTVIDKVRTDHFYENRKTSIMENVLNEDDVRNIKNDIGADLIVTGTIHSFNKGKYGSPGSYVHFIVTCFRLTTGSEMFWSGTVDCRSGAYNYDKSPTSMVKQALDALFQDLKQKIQSCE